MAEEMGVPFPRDKTGCGAYPASYPMSIGFFFFGCRAVRSPNAVKNNGAISPFPIHLHGVMF
jgi:hypothetical protein